MIGTIANTIAIVVGSLVGGTVRHGLKEKYQDILFVAMGLAATGLGINAVVQNMSNSTYPVLFIASLALGGVIGSALELDRRFNDLVNRRKKRTGEGSMPSSTASSESGEHALATSDANTDFGESVSAANYVNSDLDRPVPVAGNADFDLDGHAPAEENADSDLDGHAPAADNADSDLDGHASSMRDANPDLGRGLSTAIMLFCVGTLSILGPINSALYGDETFLFTNAMLDLVTSMVLASTFGYGIAIAAVVLFCWQGSIYLLANVLSPLLSGGLMTEISIVGGFLIFASGLSILKIKEISTMNLLPALFVPPLWFALLQATGNLFGLL